MKRAHIFTALTITVLALSVSACSNTFNGIGRDVEHAGEKIQDTF